MADEQEANGTQVEPGASPQAGGEATAPQAGGSEFTMSAEEARKLRAESRNMRKRLEEYEQAAKQAEESQLTEAQKTAKRLKELEAENAQLVSERQERVTRGAVADAARTAGAIYPDDVYDLLKSDLEVGDDGKPRNLRGLVAALKERRPALFQRVSGDGGAGNGAKSSVGMNEYIRQKAGWG